MSMTSLYLITVLKPLPLIIPAYATAPSDGFHSKSDNENEDTNVSVNSLSGKQLATDQRRASFVSSSYVPDVKCFASVHHANTKLDTLCNF